MVNDIKKYALVQFGAGLGDTINGLVHKNLYNNLNEFTQDPENKLIIHLSSHNSYAKELFTTMPNFNRVMFFDLSTRVCTSELSRMSKTDRLNTIATEELKYLADHNIDPKIVSMGRGQFHDNNPIRPVFYPTPDDRKILHSIFNQDKPIITISGGAGCANRNIPIKILKSVAKFYSDEYQVVQVGRDCTNDLNNTEPVIVNSACTNLINKLSVPGTLELIKRSKGAVLCDSSMLCFAHRVNQNVFVFIPDKTNPRYGFTDITQRDGYFKCFDKSNVLVCDFAEYKAKYNHQFAKILAS